MIIIAFGVDFKHFYDVLILQLCRFGLCFMQLEIIVLYFCNKELAYDGNQNYEVYFDIIVKML